MSGLAQFVANRGLGTLQQWCEEGYNTVSSVDEELSGERVPRQKKTETPGLFAAALVREVPVNFDTKPGTMADAKYSLADTWKHAAHGTAVVWRLVCASGCRVAPTSVAVARVSVDRLVHTVQQSLATPEQRQASFF